MLENWQRINPMGLSATFSEYKNKQLLTNMTMSPTILRLNKNNRKGCPCLRNIYEVAAVLEWGCAYIPSFLDMEGLCASLLRCLVDENFCPWWGHGGPVVVKLPV